MSSKSEREIIADLEQRLERMNERLVEVENTRTLFISNMLNEINNPLTSILGLTQQLLNVQNPDWNQVTETLSWVNEEASFLSFQLLNIFAAAQFEAGTMKTEIAQVHINEIWSKLSTPYMNTIHRKRLKVLTNDQFMLPPTISGKLLFRSDARLLSLMMVNLFDNAIKIAPNHSTIRVQFIDQEGALQFSVVDEGPGIAQEQHKRIFDRFRQLDDSTTKQFRGMGLGLSLVLAVCDILGGEVVLESAPGEGARFTVTIPEAEEGQYVDSSLDNLMFFDDDLDEGEEESF